MARSRVHPHACALRTGMHFPDLHHDDHAHWPPGRARSVRFGMIYTF
jgi:hypothetical protein